MIEKQGRYICAALGFIGTKIKVCNGSYRLRYLRLLLSSFQPTRKSAAACAEALLLPG